MTDLAVIPSFKRGVKFRHDPVRQAWILLAPEKLFMPDEIAVEILKLVDGERSIEVIATELAARFNAPFDLVATDVAAALEDLSARGAVQL
jgi:pyrroloquinoline quinone biosynthesis protein D